MTSLLGVEVRFAERRRDDVAEHFLARGRCSGRTVRVERGHLGGGEGVVVGADLIEIAIDLGGAAPGVPLNIMCSRKWLTPMRRESSSARAGLHEEADGGGVGFTDDLSDHVQAVGQRACLNSTGMRTGYAHRRIHHRAHGEHGGKRNGTTDGCG